MVNFLPNLISVVKEDSGLANNVMLRAIVENVQLKAGSFSSEYEMQEHLKLQLEGFNAYVGNEKIADIITKIDEELAREKKDNVHLAVSQLYDETNLVSMMESIRSSEAYKEAPVKNYIDNLSESIRLTSTPKFRYLPGFVSALQNMMHHTSINEAVTKVQNYMNNNYPKLVLMEAIHYLDTTANGFYKNVAAKLKKHLLNEQYSADVIAMDLGSIAEMGVITNMLSALRSIQNDKAASNGFYIGEGNAAVKVYNYIGPVLKEGNSLIAYVGNAFMHITPEIVDPINYRRIVEKVDGITIAEFDTKYIFENKKSFHDLALSFATLGFKHIGNGISSRLRNLKVDFKVNEEMNLDLYINDRKIQDPKQVNIANLFVMENVLHKNCALNVFENFENVFNVEFMKFVVNESTGKHALLLNVKDNFVVYEMLDGGKSEIKKMDKFQLIKYIAETFNYDISDYYKIDYNEAVTKIKLIEHKKTQITQSIMKLEESLLKIQETLNKDIAEKDRKDLTSLKEEVENEIIKLKNAYVVFENEKAETESSGQAQETSEKPGIGSDVEVNEGGQRGKIVAITGDQYTIFGNDNKFASLTKDQFTLVGKDEPAAVTEEMEAATAQGGGEATESGDDAAAGGGEATAQAEQTGTENTDAAKAQTEGGGAAE